MKEQIEIIKKIRKFLLESIKDLSVDQLNTIPAGFNNNIIWNLGHMIAAQQGICYVRAGLQPPAGQEVFDTYKTGTKPDGKANEEEIKKIKDLFLSSLQMLENDFEKKIWTAYPAWSTRYDVTISSIDEAIRFLLFHEGLHLGYISALKKIV